MTLLWVEGFEAHRTEAALTLRYESLDLQALGPDFVTGRLHGTALNLDGVTNPTILTKQGLSPVSDYGVVSFGMKFRRLVTDTNIVTILNSSSQEEFALRYSHVSGDTFNLQVVRGGTPLETTASTLGPGYYYIEFKYDIHTSTGTYEVRVNEVAVLGPATSQNTSNAGSNSWDQVSFRGQVQDSGGECELDDIIIMDSSGQRNTFQGDVVVEKFTMNADGDTNQWAAQGAGDNYVEIDDVDVNDGDSTYVSTNDNGQIDLYGNGGVTFITGNILGVHLQLDARLIATGSRNIRHIAKSGAVPAVNNGATQAVNTTSYAAKHQIWEREPEDLVDWTPTTLDAAQFGMETVA